MKNKIISTIVGLLISSNCLANTQTHQRPEFLYAPSVCYKAPTGFQTQEEKLKYLRELELYRKTELENFDNFNSIFQDASKTRGISRQLFIGSVSLLIPNLLNKARFFQKFFQLDRTVFSKSGGLNLAKLDTELAAGYLFGLVGLEFLVTSAATRLAMSPDLNSDLFQTMNNSYRDQTLEVTIKLIDTLSTVSNCKITDVDNAVKKLRDEVFNNELNGSLYNGIEDRLTLGRLAARGSAKLVYLSYLKLAIIESQIYQLRIGL